MTFKYTEEQLNKLDKDLLVLSKKIRFGRFSEKMSASGQICFMEVDGTIVFFNEAEAVCNLEAPEPEDLELKVPKKKKQAGKKVADIAALPVRRIDHYMSEDELTTEFGENGWKQLPDAVSPSLAAAVINGKYVNAVPLYRLEKEFERYGLAITRQNMANWMIRLGEEYLGPMYDHLHKLLYGYHVIQADETPVRVNILLNYWVSQSKRYNVGIERGF